MRAGNYASRARAPRYRASAVHLRLVGRCCRCAFVGWVERKIDGMATSEPGALDYIGGHQWC